MNALLTSGQLANFNEEFHLINFDIELFILTWRGPIILTTLFISELGRITDNKKIENDVAKTPATRDHASLTR